MVMLPNTTPTLYDFQISNGLGYEGATWHSGALATSAGIDAQGCALKHLNKIIKHLNYKAFKLNYKLNKTQPGMPHCLPFTPWSVSCWLWSLSSHACLR
jgi:hypothetical protein